MEKGVCAWTGCGISPIRTQRHWEPTRGGSPAPKNATLVRSREAPVHEGFPAGRDIRGRWLSSAQCRNAGSMRRLQPRRSACVASRAPARGRGWRKELRCFHRLSDPGPRGLGVVPLHATESNKAAKQLPQGLNGFHVTELPSSGLIPCKASQHRKFPPLIVPQPIRLFRARNRNNSRGCYGRRIQRKQGELRWRSGVSKSRAAQGR